MKRRRYLKYLVTGVLLAGSLQAAARQNVDSITESILQGTVQDSDVDTSNLNVISPVAAPYLWDEAVPVDADTLSDDDDGTAPLMLRKVPEIVKKDFRDDKDLHYVLEKKKTEDPARRFLWLAKIFGAFIQMVSAFRYFIIIALLILMGWITFRFMKRNGYVFRRQSVFQEDGMKEITDEDQHVLAYEKQIQAAIVEGRYRLAVRLLYLQTLRMLADREVIVYSKEKTNAAYLRAMMQSPYYKAFATLTLDYEYIWYGEVPVSNEQFNVIHRQFSQFLNELGYSR